MANSDGHLHLALTTPASRMHHPDYGTVGLVPSRTQTVRCAASYDPANPRRNPGRSAARPFEGDSPIEDLHRLLVRGTLEVGAFQLVQPAALTRSSESASAPQDGLVL